MKWTEPKRGDIKIRKKFAFIPIKIGYEVRWLEFVTIKYQYFTNSNLILGWWPIEFIDKQHTFDNSISGNTNGINTPQKIINIISNSKKEEANNE